MLDYSYMKAVPLLLRSTPKIHLVLIGCGGTGSWTAPHVARIAALLAESGKKVYVSFFDKDTIEPNNISRQNFCEAELGRNKAVSLAYRYGLAHGIEINAIADWFDIQLIPSDYDCLTILIGCVDARSGARASIAEKLVMNFPGHPPRFWYLDGGNSKESGQVLLGSTADRAVMEEAFKNPHVCTQLPSPTIQHPELLEPPPVLEENLSCAELMALNAQSLAINMRVAAELTDYLTRMLLTHDLKKFATYFDLPSGSTRSSYIEPDAIARIPLPLAESLFLGDDEGDYDFELNLEDDEDADHEI